MSPMTMPQLCLCTFCLWVAAAMAVSAPARAEADGAPPGPPVVNAAAQRERVSPPPPPSTYGVASETDESRAATQVASFAVTQLKDSPAVVTVISGEDIRAAGARDLVDILSLVPGYFIGLDTEGVVGPGVRGLWGHEGKILLIIDGKEMNELLFSNMQLGNEFPVELIERVEVVRGPGSVIYGGSAELSVINVITRGLQGSTDTMATATYGQMTGANRFATGYGRRRVTVSGRFVVDAVPGLSSFASVSVGQGQRSVRDFVDNTGVAASMEDRSALDPTVVQAGIGYRDVQASFLYHHLATTTISGTGQTLAVPEQVNFDAFHGEVLGTFHPNARFEVVPRFNFTYQRPWHAPAPMGDLFFDKSVRRLRGRLLGRWAALDQLQITLGGDAIFDRGTVLSPPAMMTGLQTRFGDADSVAYQTLGAYIELFSENPVVNVVAGARYDHESTIGGALVPRLVLIRTFGRLSLKGLFSFSFRAPSVENINLGINVTPERTRIFEFEGSLDLTATQRLSANIYDITIDKPIAFTFDPVTNNEGYLNLGRQGTRGFEVSYRLRAPVFRLEANYSFYAPSVSENIAPYVVPGHGEQFLAAPAHRGSVRATLRPWPWLGVSPSATVLGPRFTKGAPDAAGAETAIAIPTQVLANLFVYCDNVGIRGLTVGVGIYNMLGTGFGYVHASAKAPFDSSPAAAIAAFEGDHAQLPGLDREVMLRVSYFVEPSETRSPR
jgi:outer membrane receptor protein involved in Fe transport